jgi:uncharacterized membrane protein YhaH (DUF805 family)
MLSSIRRAFSSNYANFKGRSSRAEYWTVPIFFVAVVLAVTFLTVMVVGLLGAGETAAYVAILLPGLIAFLPLLSVTVRRCHDFGATGWPAAPTSVPYVSFVAHVAVGAMGTRPGPNRFGGIRRRWQILAPILPAISAG